MMMTYGIYSSHTTTTIKTITIITTNTSVDFVFVVTSCSPVPNNKQLKNAPIIYHHHHYYFFLITIIIIMNNTSYKKVISGG